MSLQRPTKPAPRGRRDRPIPRVLTNARLNPSGCPSGSTTRELVKSFPSVCPERLQKKRK
jgi:hypothetical protein